MRRLRSIFKDAAADRAERSLDADDADAFVTAMWNKDEKTASEMLTKILWNSIGWFDYGEEYYHGLLNRIFTARGFSTDSNDEAIGRGNLCVRNRPERTFLLLAFKRSGRKEDLDADCDEAIARIFEKGYDKVMPEGYEHQLLYGIAFYAKTAQVKFNNRNIL